LSTVHFSSWFLYLYNTIDSLHNFEKRRVTLCSHYVAGIKCTKMSCSFSWERKRWHSGGSLGWPFPKLKYKYIFQIKYTEAIYPNSTQKLFWFEISKMLNAVLKSKFIVLFIIIVGTISFPVTHVIRPEKCPMTHRLIACSACWCIIAVYCMIELLLTVLESWDC